MISGLKGTIKKGLTNLPEQIHDKGYKRILSKKKNFLSLLKTFINATWVNELTEENLELINGEFIPKDFKEKESDIIYKVKTKETEVIFYFLLELQSSVDFTICMRLLAYVFELYKRIFLDTDENIRERVSFRLPSIIPCILYNGGNKWTAVGSFKEYLIGYELFEENVINFKYILFNVNQYSDETLQEIGNLISSIFALDKKQDIDNLLSGIEKVYKIFKNLSEDEKIDLMDWINDVLMKKAKGKNVDIIKKAINGFEKGEINHMTYAIERLMDEIEEKGISKGIPKGKLENEVELIRKKIVKGMNHYEIAEIFELDEDYILEIYSLINENPLLSDSDIAQKIIEQKNDNI